MSPSSPPPSGRLHDLRGWARKVYVILGNTLFLFLLVELAARWFVTSWLGHQGLDTYTRRVLESLHPFFQTTNAPGEGIDPGPDFAGWRIDPPGAGREEGRRRILFLGGSTTVNNYPHFTRPLLEEKAGPVTVYNLGAGWHTSLHSLYKFWTYADEIRPDLVIVLHAINDFTRGFTSPLHSLPQYRPDYSHSCGGLNISWWVRKSDYDGRPVFCTGPMAWRGTLSPLLNESPLGIFRDFSQASIFLREVGELSKPRPPAHRSAPFPNETLLRSLPAFERNMRNIRQSCQAKGTPLLFLTMPFCETIPAERRLFMSPGLFFTNDGVTYLEMPDFARGMRRFNETVRRLAAPESGVWVCDLEPILSHDGEFKDEVHPTEEALRREAAHVASFILENGLLERR